MEFLDDDSSSRPRVLFQSRAIKSSAQSATSASKSFNKIQICFTTSIAIGLISITFLYLSNLEPVTSILLWIAVAIALGPFAPASVTGGDIRVGNGSLLEDPDPEPDQVEPEVRKPKRGSWRKNEEENRRSDDERGNGKRAVDVKVEEKKGNVAKEEVVEGEWTEEDFEMLKKQMVKNPVGKVRRWEVIAEAFGGRHKVESVINMGKSLGERRIGNSGDDSYVQFLKNRKPLDSRASESENGELNGEELKEDGEIGTGWSVAEDKALLNALKAFPKEVAMRWEKISAAVPGRSKKACMKRVADMKKDFRSSKAS